MIRIGVDVGGTNTDAVVLQGHEFLGGHKSPTTKDVISGVHTAVSCALKEAGIEPSQVDAVMAGTTHFVNALVERKAVAPTGVIRLCLPSGGSLKPFADWPKDLVQALGADFRLVHGGYEMDGREISALDRDELLAAADALIQAGCTQIAVSSVFSTVRGDMEAQAMALLTQTYPEASFTSSNAIGRMGLMERENAAIINASLKPLAKDVVAAFAKLASEIQLECPLFFTKNDGTLIDAEEVEHLPVLTFACGPTNSMRGAAFLSGVQNALVVDIGGTTTDVGEVRDGFPRLAGTSVTVAQVQTNFSMPDVISVGLGGGSIVRERGDITVGPDSVGYRLLKEGRVFGGKTLTASDIAVAAGRAQMGDCPAPQVKQLDQALEAIDKILVDATARARSSGEDVTVLAVGGGSILMPSAIDGLTVVRPKHHDMANAVGAAIAQVSGEVSKIIQLTDGLSRDQAIAQVTQEAKTLAIARGAAQDTIEVLSMADVPLSYLPGNNLQISVTVVGDLNMEAAK